jgi:aspartyl protease family protein
MQIIQLVSLVGFLALVLGSLSVRNMQFGFIVKTVIGWAAIAALIYVVVINKDRIGDQLEAITTSVGLSEPAQVTAGETVRIRLSPDGHFWARATINGVERRMLIDSGATVSAISEGTAQGGRH